nr:MAG TPA: Major capsid protein [Caudoviricetes sp.]
MANVTGQGTLWNLPNYAGDLFTADLVNTPFLTAIGGLTGGMQPDNFESPTASQYSLPEAKQPAITETASLTAPAATGIVRTQNTNVTQIFQEKVSISYVKMSNSKRMSGLNTAGQQNNVPDEKSWQIAKALEKIARDVEYTFLNGVYAKATSADVANKTRGMIALCSDGNTIAAGGKALTKANLQALFKKMYDAGAIFKNMVLWVGSTQKQIITDLYSYAPTDRNLGGTNIKQLETDFGNIGIALNRFMPQDTVLAAEMSVIAPVFQPVPGKGNFFYEALSKTGASEDGQIFGQIGLDHGPKFMHGTITGLTTGA